MFGVQEQNVQEYRDSVQLSISKRQPLVEHLPCCVHSLEARLYVNWYTMRGENKSILVNGRYECYLRLSSRAIYRLFVLAQTGPYIFRSHRYPLLQTPKAIQRRSNVERENG